MKKLFFYFSLLIASKFSFAQTYTVPNAQVQPAWVFPIWFEDGEGAKDTIYFCYDPLGDENYPSDDTIFGEKIIYKDSSKFWAGIWAFPAFDSAAQVYVGSDAAANIFFHKGRYPLKIKWDDTLFYSSSLPYPDLSPFPTARIAIICSDLFSNCPSDVELSITSINSSFPFPLIDSAVFQGSPDFYVGGTFTDISLYLKPFNSPIIDAILELNPITISAYPVVTQKGIWLEPVNKEFKLMVFNSIGQLINQASVTPVNSKAYFDLSSYSAGIYFVKIQSLNLFHTFKILKQ